ncbi:MAG: NAD(P)H-dependent oxidoreductase [Candidatus Heimdallarchaeota archaeon]|nr:NAD(P)H-dependent oxidoreductase [Candidatus Heimdallarchaeota archaeon]MBY8993917.1 NAD(P)H-dependent oxidoreductase [Candidatus Heimdallarchaeota archaeon]
MTKVLFVIGSPRGKKSSSFSFGKYLEEKVQGKGLETSTLILRNQLSSDEKISQMLTEINNSDVIILIAPLYDDCQPYIVTKLMELIAAKKMNLEGKRFIPIVNCGLSEAVHITAVSIPIYQKFAENVGFKWGGSLAIQAGEMFRGRYGKQLHELGKEANILRGVLDDLADAISTDSDIPDMAPKILPGMFYWKILQKPFAKMNTSGWRKAAKEKGEDPDARPYLD